MKIAFHTLGCKVNQYETEAMKERFIEAGYEIVQENKPADVYVINTCTVTNVADRKSRQFIRRARKMNRYAKVVVTGCYAQTKPYEVAGMDGVNLVIGNEEKQNIVSLIENIQTENETSVKVERPDKLCQYNGLEIKGMRGKDRAYVKIEDGCDRFCSYCVIPYARGRVRSRSEEEIIAESRNLIESGYRELILTGINTALYGKDIHGCSLDLLLKRMDSFNSDYRIRLSSLEPTVVDADFVERLFPIDHLCHHLHLSLQSGSDRILKRMNRHYIIEEYIKIVDRIKEFDPLYGISTDIIVGFPGENEKDFQCSIDIIDKIDFCKVHCFRYSPRKGTSAADMQDQIPGQVKNERMERLTLAAEKSEMRFAERNIGSVCNVLIEEDGTGYTGNYIKVNTIDGCASASDTFQRTRLKCIENGKIRGDILYEAENLSSL